MENPKKPRSFGLSQNHIALAQKRIAELKGKENKTPLQETSSIPEVVEKKSDLNKIVQVEDLKTDEKIDSIKKHLELEYYSDSTEHSGNIQKIISNARPTLVKQRVLEVVIENANKAMDSIDPEKDKVLSNSFKTGKDINNLYLETIRNESYFLNRKAALWSYAEQKLIDNKFLYSQVQEIKETAEEIMDKAIGSNNNVDLNKKAEELVGKCKEKIVKNIQEKIKSGN